METTQTSLLPPTLEEIAFAITPAIEKNFTTSKISVEACPDLREAPFHLANEGLCGNEAVADIGGQSNLFPEPRLDRKYSLVDIAKQMNLDPSRGHLLGAGAGPFHRIGQNSELAPNLSWEGGFENVKNLTHYTKFDKNTQAAVCEKSPTTDCALMMNLYASSGLPGNVLKITAKSRHGSSKSLTELIRTTLAEKYGDQRPISMGGVFVIKRGKASFHIMPDFPPKDQLPFKDPKQLNDWLTYHDFEAPIVCLTVFHSADPGKKLGLRMEHTHCFAPDGGNRGGHYHGDLPAGQGVEEVEYEAYFQSARTIFRIDKPKVTLEKDLHD